METLSINIKIEMKGSLGRGLEFLHYQGRDLRLIYNSLNKDWFLLPYRVQKLSKKARRNTNFYTK